jgi:hypothetical protein
MPLLEEIFDALGQDQVFSFGLTLWLPLIAKSEKVIRSKQNVRGLILIGRIDYTNGDFCHLL